MPYVHHPTHTMRTLIVSNETARYRVIAWVAALTAVLLPVLAQAQAPGLTWTTNVGARLFAVDGSGNSYASVGGKVIIINSSGQAVQTNTICNLPGIAARDAAGNYYFTGKFDGTNDFGGISLVGGCTICGNGKWAPGYPSGFLAKYSSAGALQWVTKFGAIGSLNIVSSIALDDSGNAYVGYTESGRGTVATFSNVGSLVANVTLDSFQGTSYAVTVGGVTSSNCAALVYNNFQNMTPAVRVNRTGGASGAGIYPLRGRSTENSNGIPVIDDLAAIFQAGRCFDPISDPECSAQKFRKCGPGSTELWSLEITTNAHWTMARDAQANVYVGGTNGFFGKFNNDGSLVWSNTLSSAVVRMVVSSSGSRFLNFADGSVARLNDDAGSGPTLVGMQANTASPLESAGSVTVSVTRSGNSSGTTTVDFATGGGTATPGVDYTTTSGTLTLTNGQTQATISVPILNNLQVQSSRTFDITLSNLSVDAAYGIYTNTTVTILDDDSVIRFPATNFTFRESVAICKIPVIREGYLGNTVTAAFAVTNGTAIRGTDYDVQNVTGTLTFSSGVSTQYVVITNLDDGIIEADETVLLSLSSPGGQAQLGTPAAATMTIFDNERVYVITNATEQALLDGLATGSPLVFDCDGTITLSNTLLLTNETSIDGSGHSIILSGGGAVRVITASPSASLTLKYLTIADGYDTNTFIGCGGVSTEGATTVIGCTFSNNVGVIAPDGCGALRQRAAAGSFVTVVDSTFVGNRGSGGAGAIDTGLMLATHGIRVTNCTFYGNSGGTGAVLVREPIAQPSFMVNCTAAWNTNLNPAGVTICEGYMLIPTIERLRVINTITAYNVGGPAGIGFIDGGHNMTADNSAVFTNATSYKNTDPLLGSLADNGGPTWTMALGSSSPAIGTADTAAGPAADQRGLLRPYGANSDIGAYEWAPEFVIQGFVGGTMLTNEVTVSINGTTMTTTNGWFSRKSLSAGSYTITPLDPNYVFVPTNRTVTVGPNKLNANFSAYQRNSLSLESFSKGVLSMVYAGTNAQVVQVQVSTNGYSWYPVQTNSIGTNNILGIEAPVENSVQLYRIQRLQ